MDTDDNNSKKHFQGLFLLESSGVPGGDAGDAVSTGAGKNNDKNDTDSNKKYLTEKEREKLKGKKVTVHLFDVNICLI